VRYTHGRGSAAFEAVGQPTAAVMKPHYPRDGTSHTADVPPGRTPAAGADFSWPPTADDLAGCGIISLTGDAATDPRHRVFVRLPDILAAQDAHGSPRRSGAAPVGPGRRARHWGVAQPGAAYPFHVDGDDPMAAASAGGEVRRALVAVAAGLSLALLSYAQFRSLRADASALVTAMTQPTPVPADRHGPEPVMEIPQAIADRIAPPESVGRRIVDRVVASSASQSDGAVTTTLARLASDVIEEARTPDPIETAAPAPIERRPDVEAVLEPRPYPAVAVAEPRPVAPVAVAALHVEPIPGDEDRIRAALTQWRTAYSSLDASAAREVWPSVDARALERAFQDLKSQDLRFDRCDLTVDGGRAQAACSGRATYVPRVGNPTPKAMPREWTFELKKLDQRWTIASARAS
jgi:hypothetical protein